MKNGVGARFLLPEIPPAFFFVKGGGVKVGIPTAFGAAFRL